MKKVFSFVAVAAMTVALYSCNEATDEAVTEGEGVEAVEGETETEPAVEEPAVEEPAVEEPAVEEPAADDAAGDDAATEETM